MAGQVPVEELALIVGDALRRHKIVAVLTGGACAALHSAGQYQSMDIDFVLPSPTTRHDLDAAMASVGFRRVLDRYIHPQHPFFVEFPAGSLAIGEDHDIKPMRKRRGKLEARTLSPTDACRDRLAAFFHWNDRNALAAAIAIAEKSSVNLDKIKQWSRVEGKSDEFEEFRARLKRARGKS